MKYTFLLANVGINSYTRYETKEEAIKGRDEYFDGLELSKEGFKREQFEIICCDEVTE